MPSARNAVEKSDAEVSTYDAVEPLISNVVNAMVEDARNVEADLTGSKPATVPAFSLESAPQDLAPTVEPDTAATALLASDAPKASSQQEAGGTRQLKSAADEAATQQIGTSTGQSRKPERPTS